MQLHPRLPGVFLVALGLAAIMSACGSAQPSGSPQPPPVASALGTIAYIDSSGCVARADAATGQPAGEAYCPASRKGATSVTWIDQDSAAYVTAESKAMGWQLVHFDSGKSETMDIADGPRV